MHGKGMVHGESIVTEIWVFYSLPVCKLCLGATAKTPDPYQLRMCTYYS